MKFSNNNKLNQLGLLYSMLRIRRIEEAIAERYAEQEMRCPMHLSIGQEAIAVGVCSALSKDDVMFSNHRAHGHFLAKGGNLNSMIAELYGRSSGCCGGRGGSMHLIDLDVNFMGATPIVGGTVPLAVGAAWAISLQEKKCISIIFLGDGCFEEGVVHEAMNFSVLHKLPILFICENNNFSVYTRLNERQADRSIYKIAEAHGLNSFVGNGNDVNEVLSLASVCVRNARQKKGPQFIELKTYRWREHCGPDFDDFLGYRSSDEVKEGIQNCPIARITNQLIQNKNVSKFDIEKIECEISLEIRSAFDFALLSEKPSLEDSMEKVFA
ncbi:MAG: hypothetical protein RL621_831 [Bacteroidota bacterium]|jgi:pyruvate dehydrogenase E1 component alpha subunit